MIARRMPGKAALNIPLVEGGCKREALTPNRGLVQESGI
jgi:hypothetical protein